jgi:hypothetical protein
MPALVNGLSPLGARCRHGEPVMVTQSLSLSLSLSLMTTVTLVSWSVPPQNTLINEFLQLSANLHPTIQIPNLMTSIFHTFILFVLNCGDGWLLSAISLSKQLCLLWTQYRMFVVQTILRHVKKKFFNQVYGDVQILTVCSSANFNCSWWKSKFWWTSYT